MSEEDKIVDKTTEDAPKDEAPTKEELLANVQVELETQARAQNWRPLEEWEGDPKDWRDARSFLDRGELLNKISATNRENKQLRIGFKNLQDHNQKLIEANAALSDLREQKRQHIKEGETEKAFELDDKIDFARDKVAEAKAAIQVEQVALERGSFENAPAQFTSWVERNSWYAQDGEMKAFADQVGMAHTQATGIRDPEQVLKYVEQRVRKAYPEKFTNVNRDKPSSVEGGTGRRSTGVGTGTKHEFSAMEEKVFQSLKAQDPKVWTREKYAADLKAAERA